MQLLRRAVVVASVALAAAAAASPHVDFDPTVDFQAWQRFSAPLPPADAKPVDPMDNELLRKRARASVVDALTKRGLTLDDAAPQFTVRATLVAKEGAKRKPSMSFGLGTGSYGSSGGISIGAGKTVGGEMTTEYTIMVEVRDAASGELAWQGWREVSEKVGDSSSSALDKAVREVLKAYPPKPKKK